MTIPRVTDTPAPTASSATFEVLHTGYNGDRVACTVGLVRDGDLVLVLDPGMVASHAAILDPLGALGVNPADVTDVVLSHHHPDHTLRVALFEHARVHDHWAAYLGDVWTWRDAEGLRLSDAVVLLKTPGHTKEDVTTLVGTADGVVAFTHLWWHAAGPVDDPYAPDAEVLRAQRLRVLTVADRIVPGHGAPFAAAAAPTG